MAEQAARPGRFGAHGVGGILVTLGLALLVSAGVWQVDRPMAAVTLGIATALAAQSLLSGRIRVPALLLVVVMVLYGGAAWYAQHIRPLPDAPPEPPPPARSQR